MLVLTQNLDTWTGSHLAESEASEVLSIFRASAGFQDLNVEVCFRLYFQILKHLNGRDLASPLFQQARISGSASDI
jgi:hypothetical protein